MRPSVASCLFSFPGGNDGDGGGSHVISGVTLRRLLVLLVFSSVGGGVVVDFAEDSWSGLLPVALLLCWLRKFWYCYGSVGRRRQDDEDSQSTFAAGSFIGLGGFPVSGGGGTSRIAFPLSGGRVGVFCVLGVRFGSSRRRCCRRRRTLVPLLLFVSRWLMAVQCSRSMLEVVPGAESCSRSMSWSRARRRKEDCS